MNIYLLVFNFSISDNILLLKTFNSSWFALDTSSRAFFISDLSKSEILVSFKPSESILEIHWEIYLFLSSAELNYLIYSKKY